MSDGGPGSPPEGLRGVVAPAGASRTAVPLEIIGGAGPPAADLDPDVTPVSQPAMEILVLDAELRERDVHFQYSTESLREDLPDDRA